MTIIAFISQKGGVGKSTLTQTLAVEFKKQNERQSAKQVKHNQRSKK